MDEVLALVGNLQDCPWAGWKPATLHFCEALRCERIVAPAETWTNIGYLLFALVLFWKGWQRPERGLRAVETRFGLYALIVGTCSTLFHASHTYVFETADLAAMFFLGVELIVVNLQRLGWLRYASPMPFALLLFFGSFGVLLGLEGPARLAVFAVIVAASIGLEARLYLRASVRTPYRAYFTTLLFFAFAYAAWIVDYTRVICQPDQHWISGHGVWHLLNSVCFLTLAQFYRALRTSLDPSARPR